MKREIIFGFFFFFLSGLGQNVGNPPGDLKMLFVLSSFGTSTPSLNFLNDEWIEAFGANELTSFGMRQQYILGKQLRENYNDFLKDYNQNEVFVYSSDKNRTLMSAQCLLLGLFDQMGPEISEKILKKFTIPPINVTVEEKNMRFAEALPQNYLPVPIHTNNQTFDLITDPFNSCPKTAKFIQNLKSSTEFLGFFSSFNDFLQEINATLSLSQFFGVSELTPEHLFFATEYLISGLYNNAPSPISPDSFQKALKFHDAYSFYSFAFEENRRIMNSGLTNYILRAFQATVGGSLDSKKLHVVSGGPEALASILIGLKITNGSCIIASLNENCLKYPRFSSSLVMELYEKDSVHFSRLLYNGVPLDICHNDSGLCEWRKLQKMLQDDLVEGLDEKCEDVFWRLEQKGSRKYKMMIWLVGVTIFLLGIFLVLLGFQLIREKTKKQNLRLNQKRAFH